MGVFCPRWDWWRQEGASPTLLCWIHLGVPLPLWQLPALHTLHNHQLKPLEEEFVEGEINWLLQEQALWELLPHKEALFSPIGIIPKKNGKLQLIVNMCLLNLYL